MPPARTTAAITSSIAVSSLRRPRGGDRPTGLRVQGATDRPREWRVDGCGGAARGPRFSGAAESRRSGRTDARVRLRLSRGSVGSEAAGFGTAVFAGLSRPHGPVIRCADRSTARGRAQSGRRPPGALRLALDGADGVVGELELVAAAHEQSERALALAVGTRRRPQATAEQVDGGGELVVVIGVRRRGARERPVDSEGDEAMLDALGAPRVEAPAVLGEAPREASVVEVTLALELGNRPLDARGLDPLALEMAPDLGHRAVAVAEVHVAQIERILKLSLRVRRPLDGAAHAA